MAGRPAFEDSDLGRPKVPKGSRPPLCILEGEVLARSPMATMWPSFPLEPSSCQQLLRKRLSCLVGLKVLKPPEFSRLVLTTP